MRSARDHASPASRSANSMTLSLNQIPRARIPAMASFIGKWKPKALGAQQNSDGTGDA
jgi:hypothetical protein